MTPSNEEHPENESKRAEELRVHAVLESNIRRLMRRAYVPALPAPEFRARLITLVRRETLRHGRAALRLRSSGDPAVVIGSRERRSRRRWILASLVAAAALIFLGLQGLLSVEPASGSAGDHDLNERAELRLELEHGGLVVTEESGLLLTPFGRFRFDASTGTLAAESDSDSLLVRSERNSVTLVPVDAQGLPTGPLKVLRRGTSARFLDGHFVETPPILASGSSDGIRRPQASSTQESGADEGASEGVKPPAQVVSVTDGETGAAIARVTLALVPRAQQNRVPETIKQDSRASDGRHSFEKIPRGNFKLAVFAEGYCLWVGEEREFDPEVESHIDVTLTRGGSLRGYLVDSITGNPVAGAHVVPRADLPAATVPFDLDAEHLWLPILAETKSDGSFVLAHVSPGEHELQISARGFGTRFERGVRVRADQRTDLAPIALDPEAVLEGTVSDRNGAFVQGAQVVVSPFDAGGGGLSYYSVTQTNADGHYFIGGLPSSMFFAISVPDKSGGVPDVRPFRAVSGETKHIDFGPATTGTVLGGSLSDYQGKALGEVNIALVYKSGGQPSAKDHFRASSTSPDGAYHFEGVSPGDYDLMVVGQNNSICVAGTISVTGSSKSQALDIRLGAISASGRVLRATDDAPVAGVEVALLWFEPGQSEPCFVADATTGSDGSWRATGLRPGGLLAVCYPGAAGANEAGCLGLAVSQRAEAAEGQSEVNMGSVSLFTGGAARIELKNSQGHPLIGTRVEIKTQAGLLALPSPFSSTGADGEFVVDGLAPGTYTVTTFKDDGTRMTTTLSVQAGNETLHRIEID